MEIREDWEVKLIEEARRITEHGFGKLDFQVSNPTGLNIKIIIWAGCSHIFIAKKIIDLDRKKII